MRRYPVLRRRAQGVGEPLRRFDSALIAAIRFIYGPRIAGAIAMGACGVAPVRFAVFNLLDAAIWASGTVTNMYL